jgi:hypothetical protein
MQQEDEAALRDRVAKLSQTIGALLAERRNTMSVLRGLFLAAPPVPWPVVHLAGEVDSHRAWIAARTLLANWDAVFPPEVPLPHALPLAKQQ